MDRQTEGQTEFANFDIDNLGDPELSHTSEKQQNFFSTFTAQEECVVPLLKDLNSFYNIRF